MKKFYVYVLSSKTVGPFYVGKGHGERCKLHEREAKLRAPTQDSVNPFKLRVIRKILKAGEEVDIKLTFYVTDTAALRAEKRLIAKHGRRDIKTGCLANLTDGGEGAAGYRHTAEDKVVCGNSWRGKKRPPEFSAMLKARRGEKRSDVTKARLKAAHKHRDKEAWKKKLRAAWRRRKKRGPIFSEEERLKISTRVKEWWDIRRGISAP